jgi:patatin-like phospholipase/acyl hydrolase
MSNNTKLTRILSIDGGGIKGIIPGQVLIRLESKLQEISGDRDARIADYFDLIAGTSTGGILTCIYLCPGEEGKPRFPASEALQLYIENGGSIFHRSIGQWIKSGGGLWNEKYSATTLYKSLDEYLDDLWLSQLVRPCIITAYDITNRHAHFFTQHDAANEESYDYKVKDVARSTSAAPTYFEAAHVKSKNNETYTLVDGGVFANNPALCAYAEARNLEFDSDRVKPKAAEMALLSLGTGKFEKSYLYRKARRWGLIGWVRPVIDIMMSGVAETVDYQLAQIYDAVGKPEQYLRIEPEFGEPSDMDDASRSNLMRLEELGQRCAEEKDSELERFARILFESA